VSNAVLLSRWFYSIKEVEPKEDQRYWIKARRATEKVKKSEKKCAFYCYNENGQKIGLVFDDE
jgi:hypothetical protein